MISAPLRVMDKAVSRVAVRLFSTHAAPASAITPSLPPFLLGQFVDLQNNGRPGYDIPTLKNKSHFKRASEVLNAVNKASVAHMNIKMAKFRPPFPSFNVGDAVEITYAQEISEVKPLPIRGTVMGKWKKGLDTKFTIINSWDGEWFTATYVTSSPLLRGIKVLQRKRVSEGKKTIRRGKLTNLLTADPNMYLVDANTKEMSEIQSEKEERRRLQRAGKSTKKVSDRAEARKAKK